MFHNVVTLSSDCTIMKHLKKILFLFADIPILFWKIPR